MAAEEDGDQDMLTTTDVAGRLGYSEATVRRLCEEGRFDGDAKNKVPGAWRAGLGAHWRIPVAAVEHFVDASKPKIVRRAQRVR